MSAPHSYGPWVIIKTASAAFGERAILDAEGYTICNPSPMGQANADLIVAAPDMIDALRQWAHAEATADEAELQNARASRDAAIAKAIGQISHAHQ